jgi:hypothetical protein
VNTRVLSTRNPSALEALPRVWPAHPVPRPEQSGMYSQSDRAIFGGRRGGA